MLFRQGLWLCFCYLGGPGQGFFLLSGRDSEVARFCFCYLGGGRDFSFAVGAGHGSSLTYSPAWVGFGGTSNKNKKQPKKKKRVFLD